MSVTSFDQKIKECISITYSGEFLGPDFFKILIAYHKLLMTKMSIFFQIDVYCAVFVVIDKYSNYNSCYKTKEYLEFLVFCFFT